MSRTFRWLAVASAILGPFAGDAFAAGRPRIDLTDPQQKLETYIRVNGDTSGKPVADYGSGTIYGYVPGEKPRPLFKLEVLGMGRYERIDGGYRRMHREIGYYTDLKTGAVLKRWFNPWLQREVDVVPIQNDPVNRRYTLANMNYDVMESGDAVIFFREVPLRYAHPLDRATYPLYSSGDFYEAMEMFNSYVSRRDIDNARLTSIPNTGSWTRFGPWLPWMEMGVHQGYLIYHSRSVKPVNGLDGVPQRLRDIIARENPKFLTAPDKFVEPDETSWTFFKRVVEERRRAATGK